MNRSGGHGLSVARLAGLVLPLALASALVPSRTSLSNTDAALIMVVGIVAVASYGDRFAGCLASASSGLWFDFFLTRPYERLTITRSQDIETTVLLFAVGLAVTELTARGRRHRLRASEQSGFLDELHALTTMMAEGADARIALARVEAALSSLLHLRECRYDPAPPTGRAARIHRDGTIVLAGLLWPTLPGREVELPVEFGSNSYGRFLLAPTPGKVVSLDRRRLASDLAADVGAILASSAPGAHPPTATSAPG